MTKLTDQLLKMEQHASLFENALRDLPLPVVAAFGDAERPVPVSFAPGEQRVVTRDAAKVAGLFPHTGGEAASHVLVGGSARADAVRGKRVAVLFSGGPAPGGHNVLVGIKKVLGEHNTLLGVKGGPKGLLRGKLFEISDADANSIRNTGGFDFLGTDRTKIKTTEQFASVREVCVANAIDAIVIIGGDDSNTNAAVLAEQLYTGVHADGRGVQVIGVPKTIDGDLQLGDLLPISFGFDTATKIYAELAGNILQDSRSSIKYWHFIKLMGRAASHVTLEVALQTRPAIALISEEVAAKKMSLGQIVDGIAQTVIARSRAGINHGVVLVPEGLIEFIPEVNALLGELNDLVAQQADALQPLDARGKCAHLAGLLSAGHAALFESLPEYIQDMLLADRDSHGNLQVSLIPTEQLLIDMTKRRVKELAPEVPFATQHHFFGYEGRCGAPTLFDAAYTYNLGLTAGSLILDGRTGCMASVTALDKGGQPLGIPLAGLLTIERRHGKDEFVIEKALVDISAPPMRFFAERREACAAEDRFTSPGPRQLWGPVARQVPVSVALSRGYASLSFKIGEER